MKRKLLISLFLIALLISLPISFASEINYQYDTNGNLVQDESKYYEYNGFDQLIRVRQGSSTGTIIVESFYDDVGNRILTIEYNGAQNASTFYPSDSFVQIVNSTGTYNTTYYYAGNILLAADNGSIAYYHPDHLGSTTLVTDGSGALLRETKYGPFGAVLSGGNDRYLYTGQEFDAETDLYYYGARFYKPDYYHFTQPDPNIPDLYNPQDLNRYAYVRNNPYKYVDPDGAILWDIADLGLLAWAWHDYKQDKSLFNSVNLVISVIGALPLIPNVLGYATRGAKIGSEAAKSGGKILRGIEKALDAAKSLGRGQMAIKTTERAVKPVLTERSIQHITTRHINKATQPWKSKFIEGIGLEKFVKEVVSKGEKRVQSDGRLIYTADLGRKVGTKGQTAGKVVLDPDTYEVVTAYPIKSNKI